MVDKHVAHRRAIIGARGMGRTLAAAAAMSVVMLAVSTSAHGATPLDDAPVPSLCEHPAGTLVGGQLPGIAENEGGVWLSELYQPGMIKQGKIRSAGDYAAVVSCYRGGVSWPDNIVIYDAGKQILGTVRLIDVTKSGREHVSRLRISKRTVIADVNGIEQKGDAACCGSATAQLKIRWDAKRDRIRVASKRMYSERKPMKRFIRAVNRGRRRAARKLASADVVKRFFDARSDGAKFTLRNCEGAGSDEWWMDYLMQTNEPFDGWLRACLVDMAIEPLPEFGGEQSWALLVDRRGLHGYRATGTFGVAG
jgi:hypothetical protein